MNLIAFERRARFRVARAPQRSLVELVLEASPDVIYLYDRLEQRYSFISERSKEVLGYTPEQIQGLRGDDIERLIHPDDLPRARAHYAKQQRLRDDDVSMATYRLAHARGGHRLLRCRQKVFSRTADGTAKHILGVASDITEQANTELELRGLREQIVRIRDEERRALALQLHDTAVQHLVAAALLLDSIEKNLPVRTKGALDEVHASLSRALRDIVRPLEA
jgi:PAS domain S-box-containing protein